MADEERPGGGWLPPSDRDRDREGASPWPGEGSGRGPGWTSGDPLAGGSEVQPGWRPEDDPFGRRGEESGWAQHGGFSPPTSGAGDVPPPPPAGTGGFPAPQGGGFAGRESHGKATVSLVLGIVGLVFCPLVCSVAALVFGYQARNEMDRMPGRYANRGTATAGIVLGWVGIALTVLLVILVVIGAVATEAATAAGR